MSSCREQAEQFLLCGTICEVSTFPLCGESKYEGTKEGRGKNKLEPGGGPDIRPRSRGKIPHWRPSNGAEKNELFYNTGGKTRPVAIFGHLKSGKLVLVHSSHKKSLECVVICWNAYLLI